MDDNKGMEGCSHQPGSEHDSTTPATHKDMALSYVHDVLEMCANIKNESFSLLFGGPESLDMEYVHYYLTLSAVVWCHTSGSIWSHSPGQGSNISQAQIRYLL